MPFDVVGIGNAIVDVIATTDDAFLARVGLTKGSMTLVDQTRAEAIYAQMPPGLECSGGSAGNTMAGFASFGGRGAYIGKVRADQLGQVFRHDLEAQGIAFPTPAGGEAPTARCLVLVTPDAQRTMATYLGACVELGPEEIDPDVIRAAKIVYLEGYLFDPPRAKQAFVEAARIAHEAGGEVALTLSDTFCVERHKAAFRELIEGHVDLLFANESELLALTGAASVEDALPAIRGKCKLAAVTRSEKGSLVLSGNATVTVAAEPIERLVDTTGAGDLYAGGFLFGYVRGFRPADCGRLGSLAAAEVIQHYGARPAVALKQLAQARFPELSI